MSVVSYIKYKILIFKLKQKLTALDKILPYFEELDMKISLVLRIETLDNFDKVKSDTFKRKEELRNELREIIKLIKRKHRDVQL